MGKKSKWVKHLSFPAEVTSQFGPVAEGWGMAGPVEDDTIIPTVAWTLDRLAYRWSHDPSDGELSVGVRLIVAEGVLWTSLDELVVANRLGVRQDLRPSGRLNRHVAAHTDWLRRLHGTFTSERAPEFMRSGGARLSTPDLTD